MIAKRPGRPPIDPTSPIPSERVFVAVAAVDYQKAARVARLKRESVQDVIRRGLRRLLENTPGPV